MAQYILIGKKKVKVPLEIESQGGAVVEAWVKDQQPKPKPESKPQKKEE